MIFPNILKRTSVLLLFLRTVPFLAISYFFFNTPVVSAQFSEAGVAKLKVPVEAPDFKLKGLNGGEVSLKELKGNVVILNFFGIK